MAVEPLVLGEGLTLGGIGAGSPQMIINSYNISKNMEFLKSSYFQTVPHNGLGYQLSLIMVSQPNHLLREYFGSIGIILFFAAGLRKSYWSGCMKAATVICQQIFSILALVIFLLKILLKSVSKSFFLALASRSGFGATISDAVARSSIVFCNSVSADRIVMAASRLLRAVAAFVILLSFAAGSRKSSWSGCMKAAKWIC